MMPKSLFGKSAVVAVNESAATAVAMSKIVARGVCLIEKILYEHREEIAVAASESVKDIGFSLLRARVPEAPAPREIVSKAELAKDHVLSALNALAPEMSDPAADAAAEQVQEARRRRPNRRRPVESPEETPLSAEEAEQKVNEWLGIQPE